ncbi:SPOR domain-containing protein, partial [uncultured Maritalea sp.]|uniref:SPOR domain-containing protein n=1 Tax=uncultured Maritalea sp. TaxID=757249 RepID=UPI002632B251
RVEEPIEVAYIVNVPTPPSRPEDLLAGDGTKQLGLIAINQQAPAPQRQTLEQANAFTPLDLLGNLINRNQPSTRSAPTPPQGLIPPGNIVDPQTTSSLGAATALSEMPKIWTVQIGAAKNQDGANQLIAEANNQLAILKDYRSSVQSVTRNGQSFYRARFVGFTGEAEAATACNALKERNIKCLALPG